MSCIIAVPSSSAVVLAVDTAFSATPTGGDAVVQAVPGAQKLVPLPHLSGVLAFRGVSHFGHGMFLSLIGSFGRSFDELVQMLAMLADLNQRALLENFERLGWARPESLGEVALAGWSERHQSMQAWLAVNGDLGSPFECFRLVEPYVAPCDGFDARLHGIGPSEVADLMRRQVAACRPQCPGLGGAMVWAAVSRNRLQIERHELEPAIAVAPAVAGSLH